MNRINHINVFLDMEKVGTMALHKGHTIAFEYDKNWIQYGFSISPFSLPLREGVFIPRIDPFNGLFGVFSDSLPDGWGRLLVDRMILKEKMNPHEVDNITRLAIVGRSGMGALTYEPTYNFEVKPLETNLDKLALECRSMLRSNYSKDLDELFRLGGSSGGARPKILTEFEGEEWIIKFPSSHDAENIGEVEYQYSKCAKACGIEMTETKLFPSKICSGYFGTRRFDRFRNEDGRDGRIHMISVSGLLEISHRIPNLDYNSLMKLTYALTKDYEEIEKMFRLMCFNVFAHNRDDHSKNFTFIYQRDHERWRLSPAYDLTYSYSIGGEHATMINGNGSSPDMEDLLAVADNIGLGKERSKKIAIEIREIIEEKIVSKYKNYKF